MSAGLALIEQIIDTSAAATRIEALLPTGVRRRQLSVRTLLVGILLVAAAHRPMFVLNIYRALISLPEADKLRLGIIAHWKPGEHLLTYRQTERTLKLIRKALAKNAPDGQPFEPLQQVIDALLEASVKICGQPATSSYALDWTDLESWGRPPHGEQPSVDPDAAWGHRNTNHPARSETFFGYYLQALTTVKDERGPEVPELVRRIHIAGCQHDPPQQIVPVIERVHQDGIPIEDLLMDSGYSYRTPEHWALPIRRLHVKLIMDLHTNDRGPKGTHHGAIITNGRLYCPATPTKLLELAPLPPGADTEQTAAHDQQCRELARHKLSPHSAPDPDGYHRASCPATQGKLRCPLRPASMTLPHDRPTILHPPEHPPVCCTQTTITVPPSINAKTAQKHDFPSPEHRASYNRRTAAERANASLKDPATSNLARGFCRLTDLPGITLLTTAVVIARNLRIAHAFTARQPEQQRRTNNCATAKRQRRRRQTLEHLLAAADSSP